MTKPKCSGCEREYAPHEWKRLPLVGRQDYEGIVEMRNCLCRPKGERFTLGVDRTEHEEAERRGRLYEALRRLYPTLNALLEEHGLEDVTWAIKTLQNDHEEGLV